MKKATQQDVAKMEGRLKQDASWTGEHSLGRQDTAQSMAKARALVADSAFSKEGRTMAGLGDVREAFMADLEKFDKNKKSDDDDNAEKTAVDDEAGGSPGKKGDKKKDLDRLPNHTLC